MTSKSTGDYTETKAVEIYEMAGFTTETPTASGWGKGNEDYWNVFDGMAYGHGQIRYWQAKTTTASGIHEWLAAIAPIQAVSGVECDFLVRHSGEGWRLMKPYEDTFRTVCDTRESDRNMGDRLAEYIREVSTSG